MTTIISKAGGFTNLYPVTLAIVATIIFGLVGCNRTASLPRTSPEATALAWVDHADVLTDFRQHVEHDGDTRFLSQSGLSFATEFPGLQETPELQQIVKEHGSRRIEGTTDVINSLEQQRLLGEVTFYAARYNSMLLGYIDCTKERRSTTRRDTAPNAAARK
jgi:hypothetical protein